MLHDSLQCNIINTGFVGGADLQYILNEVIPYVKKDDIIILAPEYNFFTDKYNDYNIDALIGLLCMDYSSFYKFTIKQKIDVILKGTPELFIRKILYPIACLFKINDKIYINQFNEYGDLTSHLTVPSDFKYKGLNPIPCKIDSSAINVFNRFKNDVARKHVSVYMSFPPVPDEGYKFDSARIDKFIKELSKDLSIRIISNPIDYVYDNKYFFNTKYHLNKDGRELRKKDY